MKSLRLTVVTPSFNQAAYVEATLLSVLNQDYRNTEYIVIDGGSTDGSVTTIAKYSDKLAYWCSEPDRGQADAIAKGFERATGDVYCWINSDDLLLPGALTSVARHFTSHPKASVLTGGAYAIDCTGTHVRGFGTLTRGISATYDRFRFYGQDNVFQPATFWRREAYEAAGGIDRSLQFIMDYDLFTRLARRSTFSVVPDFLAAFRLHDASKSATLQHLRRQECLKFARRYGVDRYSPRTRCFLYWWYRIPALARKLCWRVQRECGLLCLPGATA